MRNYHKELVKWHKKVIKELKIEFSSEYCKCQSYYETLKGKDVPPKKLGVLNRMRKTAQANLKAIEDREKDLQFLLSIPEVTFNRIYGWGYADGQDRKAMKEMYGRS